MLFNRIHKFITFRLIAKLSFDNVSLWKTFISLISFYARFEILDRKLFQSLIEKWKKWQIEFEEIYGSKFLMRAAAYLIKNIFKRYKLVGTFPANFCSLCFCLTKKKQRTDEARSFLHVSIAGQGSLIRFSSAFSALLFPWGEKPLKQLFLSNR